jgi:hypothetical protein
MLPYGQQRRSGSLSLNLGSLGSARFAEHHARRVLPLGVARCSGHGWLGVFRTIEYLSSNGYELNGLPDGTNELSAWNGCLFLADC